MIKKRQRGVNILKIFENVEKYNYVTYNKERTEIERKIMYSVDLAETTNKLLAVLLNESIISFNQSILNDIAFLCLLKHLETLGHQEAIQFMEQKALKRHYAQKTLNDF